MREHDQSSAPIRVTGDLKPLDELSVPIEILSRRPEDQASEPRNEPPNPWPKPPPDEPTDRRAIGTGEAESARPIHAHAVPDSDEDPDLAKPAARRRHELTERTESGGAIDDAPGRGTDTPSAVPAAPLLSPKMTLGSHDHDTDDRNPERPDWTLPTRTEEPTMRPTRTEPEGNADGIAIPELRDDAIERIDAELVRIRKELHLAKVQMQKLSGRPDSRSSPTDLTGPKVGQKYSADVRIGQIDVIVEGRSDPKPVVQPRDSGYASRAYLRGL